MAEKHEVVTADTVMEYLFRLRNPQEPFAKKYVEAYGNCVDALNALLSVLKFSGTKDSEFLSMFSLNVSRFEKLDGICMDRYVDGASVVAELCKIKTAILESTDYEACSILLDGFRGRPVEKYVDDADSEGLEDEAVREPDLLFISHESMLPNHYTPGFSKFVRGVDSDLKVRLNREIGEGVSDFKKAVILRDLMIDTCRVFPKYEIHRILSGAVLPCVSRSKEAD